MVSCDLGRIEPQEEPDVRAGGSRQEAMPSPPRRARTSASRYRRGPPSVRSAVSFPARAQRVTVVGATRKSAATSAGVSRASPSTEWLVMGPPMLHGSDMSILGHVRDKENDAREPYPGVRYD